MTYQAPPGVFDILPYCTKDEWRKTHLWQKIEEQIHRTARDYGYQEIRTPIFERTELFKRSVGDTSDIVSKEMYTFIDKGERSLSLRPEGTAPILRAFIENQMQQAFPVHKLYHISPMFRYERSQSGRYRQHHQFGAEVIGSEAPEQDVEIIDMLYTLYNRLGITNLELCINSIGDQSSRHAYRTALQKYLRNSFDTLSEDSKIRFETNPLRILDSKDPIDRKILESAPSILDFLNQECQDHFQEVQKLLNVLHIPFKVCPHLVRGLDYYNKTVFEITSGELGAQNSIGGGGRYDGLLKLLGGPDLPATGFGSGMERIIQTMVKQGVAADTSYQPLLFIIPLGDSAAKICFSLLHQLRQAGIPTQMDFSGKKLGKAMQYANQMRAQYVTIIGDNELQNQEVELKEMSTGETTKVPIEDLAHILQVEARSDAFLDMWREMQKPFTRPAASEFFIKKLNKSITSTQKIATELENIANTIRQLLK